jgi:spore germination cell wall hydrolase CwlJ-like protein
MMRFRLPFRPFLKPKAQDQAEVEAEAAILRGWQAETRGRKLALGGVFALLLLASMGWVALTVSGSSRPPWSPPPPEAAPAAGDPAMRGLDPELLVADAITASGPEALRLNAAIAVSNLPNPAMPAFASVSSPNDLAAAEDCLTAAVYYEAGFEALEGQRAVAQVVLNRVRHPLYPKTVCGVVLQGFERSTGCQFSFTCNGAWTRAPDPQRFAGARLVARAALGGYVDRPVGAATHYHAAYVLPYWAPRLVKVHVSGLHIFYRFPGFFGTPNAMRGKYAGSEHIPDARASFRTSPQILEADLAPEIAVATLDLPPLSAPAVELDSGQTKTVVEPASENSSAAASAQAVIEPAQPAPARRPPSTYRDDRPLVPAPSGLRRNGW